MVRIQSDPRSNLARSTDDPHLPSQKGSAEDLTTWQARAAKQNPNKPGAGHVYVKMKGKATFGVDREKDPKGYYRGVDGKVFLFGTPIKTRLMVFRSMNTVYEHGAIRGCTFCEHVCDVTA